MSKGVIVMDIPNNCRDCKYFGLVCKITGERCNRYNQDKRPEWCPIHGIPMPREELRIPHSIGDYQTKGFQRGWNACLNKILEEGG